jgi:sec-independent protein translocase protein TatC
MAKSHPIDQPEPAEETQARMSFGEHLDELRRRIMLSLYGGVLGIGLCIYFRNEIFAFVARPYRIAARLNHMTDVFNTLKPQEGFMTYITLSVQAGLILTSPWIIYQIWQFVAAGLYPRERKIIYRYVAPSTLLFLLGVTFFYYIVLPMTLSFFISFTAGTAGPPPSLTPFEKAINGVNELPEPSSPAATSTAPGTQPMAIRMPELETDPDPPPAGHAVLYYHKLEARIKVRTATGIESLMTAHEGTLFTHVWRASDYISFVAFTALIFGLGFELPLVIVILAQTEIVPLATFRSGRKYAYFGILIAAVLAAPSGDPLTLLLMFLPLVGLYEVGILVAAVVVRGKRDGSEPESVA